MKYSSTSSLALNGNRVFMEFLGKGVGLLQRLQDLDAPYHEAAIDLVRIERLADSLEQHDGQLAAEVFAEFVEPAEHTCRVIVLIDVPGQVGREQRKVERLEQVENAPPFRFREKTREP